MKKPVAKHSRIGASSCERWWNCPGSVSLVATLPPQLPSKYADEGTVAHLVGEWGLRTGRDASDFIGQKAVQIKTKDGEIRFEFENDLHTFKDAVKTGTIFEVTDEMAEAVQMYLDTVRFDMSTYGLGIEDIKIEHKFHLTHIDSHAYGTNDCNLPVFLDKVVVYDYKHGQGVAVDAEDNKQLMYYALGAAELGDYDVIEVVIVQPRAIHKDGPIRRWTLSTDDLRRFGDELRERIALTREPSAELNCGSWCKKTFCPALAVCPAVRGVVEKEATVVFTEPVKVLPRPESMSPETLQRILDAMPLLDDWLKAVWAFAEQKANNGEKILGYKLVKGREGNRKWADEANVLPIKEAVKNLDVCIYEQKLLSPAKLEKLHKSLKPVIDQLTTRSEGKVILVSESDPREAVPPNATTAFIETEFDIFN